MTVEGAGVYGQAMREGHAAAWAARWREAVDHYRRAAEAIPTDVTARTSLAAALVHAGQPHDALALFEQLVVERPEDTAVLLRVAELRQRVGRVDDADRAYLEVAAKYLAAGQREKAVGVWRRLIHSSGHRGETMSAVAAAALGAGVDDVGEEARRAAAAAAPRPNAAAGAPMAAVAPAADDWVAQLGARLREVGVRPTWKPLEQIGDAYVSAAAPHTTIDDALAAVAATPADAEASRRLGTALLAAGQTEAARRQLADLADLAELNGDMSLAASVAAQLLLIADDSLPIHRRIARLALLGEAVDVAADAHLAMSDELARRGDRAAALNEARRAAAVAPVSADLQARAADRLAALNALPESDEARRRAFQLAPRNTRHVARYLASAARRGAVEELLLAEESLRQLEPDPALARALVEAELGDPSPTVLLGRGFLLAWVGAAEADEPLRRAADTPAPVGPVAARVFAERALAEDRADEAAEVLRRWVQPTQDPEGLDESARLAGLALTAADRAGDDALALASLAVLVACSPEDGTLGSLYAERLASADRPIEAARELARLAGLAQARGDLDATAALLESAALLDASTSSYALTAADLARDRGDRDQARRLYLQAADVPGAPLSALLGAADTSPASTRVDLLRRAITLAPEDPEPRRRLVTALVASGQASLAAGEAAQVAQLLLAGGDREGAGRALEEARRLDPWNPAIATLREALEGSGR
jgi:tetratricopeptide (TPR) repeat protein